MEKIKHYVLPEHTNTLYKEEAISSIGLTREIAAKINELVNAYNVLSDVDLRWKQTQEGIIRKGVLYMKDNLLNSLQGLLDAQGMALIENTVNRVVTEDVVSLMSEALKAEFVSEVDNANLYYGSEIYTEKFYDELARTDYYITHVPAKDRRGQAITFRLGLAKDDKNTASVESTIAFANRKNATLTINAGFFDLTTNQPRGSVIVDGQVIKTETPDIKYHYVCFDKQGQLKYYPATTGTHQMIADNVLQAVCGTAVLIEDHAPIEQTDVTVEPRQTIAQLDNGEVLILTVDGRHRTDGGMSFADLIRILLPYNVRCAYNLDGGGSTSTVLRGIKQNDGIDQGFKDREVSTFFYVTRPREDILDQTAAEAYKEVGRLREELRQRFAQLVDIEQGFLRLRGGEDFHFPGIEVFTDDQIQRLGKLGFQDAEDVLRSVFATLRNTDGVEQTVFRANEKGLYNIKGLLNNIQGVPPRTPDSNCNIKGELVSIYTIYEADANSPGHGCGAGYLIHLPFASELTFNIRQIFIPMNEQIGVKMRSCNASGEWGEWYDFGVMRGNSNQRPTGSKAGAMYWDTALRKPIWYTGAVWVDATGTNV